MKNKNINILVVEDEIIASEYLQNILKKLAIENIYEATSFNEALETVKNRKIDLIFMDINIDGSVDGITSAKILNQQYLLPIIFTTAYGDSQTILEASETNIFGYLIKPFEQNQVEATLLTALKRIDTSHTLKMLDSDLNIIQLGNGQSYNLKTQTLYIDDVVIHLTKKENDILYLLCKNSNQNISYETLLEYIWEDESISKSTVRDTVSRLKKKAPDLKIETLINFGYILKL